MRVCLAVISSLLCGCACQLSFLAIGDWGGQELPPWYTLGEHELAKVGMPRVGAEVVPAFVLALGDNFYEFGVLSDTSIRFDRTWSELFTDDSLQVPWHVCCGNHDHMLNCSAQISFTGRDRTKRWHFPDYNYTFTQTFQGSDGKNLSIQVVMIDTLHVAGTPEADHPYARVAPHTNPENIARAEIQLQWLEETLNASHADFLLVAGHYPVYSGCSHGDTIVLKERVEPLLERYGAFYASGHDHCLEHITTPNGIPHILSGAGVECCYEAANSHLLPQDSLKFIMARDHNPSNATAGFVSVTLDSNGGRAVYYNGKGDALFTSEAIPLRTAIRGQ